MHLEAAWGERERFPGGVHWLTADSGSGDNTFKTSLFGLATKLRMLNDSYDIEDDRLVDIATSHLLEQERCLIVVDNLDSEEFSPLVNRFINGSWVRESKVSMIITSRLKENVQRMLSYAIENEQSPACFMSMANDENKLKEATLSEWAQLVENTGHFLDELKNLDVAMDAVFDNEGFAMLLDHTSLYYYVLNQTERATVYRQLMNNHLSKQKTKRCTSHSFTSLGQLKRKNKFVS